MKLIEQLGGYESAKKISEDAPTSDCFLDTYDNSFLSKDHGHYWEYWDSDKKEWSEYEFDVDQDDFVHLSILNRSLLEYRRANNIFEIGDFVMFENKLYEIKYIYHSEKARITDGFQGRNIYDFPRGIRHATDEEIKVGHRL